MKYPNLFEKRMIKEVFFASVIFIASFVIFWNIDTSTFFGKVLSAEELHYEFLSCFREEKRERALACINARAAQWVELYGTSVGDELLYYQNNFGADTLCHQVGHIIGEALYVHYGISALSSSSVACYASILHGILGAFEADYGSAEFARQALKNDLCKDVSGNENAYALCVHGLGHTLFLASDFEYKEAAKTCWELLPLAKPESARLKTICVSGVFMELFNATFGASHYSISPETYMKDGDVFYPCTSPDVLERDRSVCFAHIQWSVTEKLEKDSRMQRILFCEKNVPLKWVDMCVRGVGYFTAAQNASDVSHIASVCKTASSSELRDACFAGALSYFATDTVNSFEKVSAFCSTLTEGGYGNVCTSR